jgi:hypothetical protein
VNPTTTQIISQNNIVILYLSIFTPHSQIIWQKLNTNVRNRSESMGDIFKIIGDLGFPVAAALAGGYFVYLTIKLLLQGVLGSVKGMAGIITALDNRVKTMNHDVVRIDTIVSNALGLRPDVDRIARADGKNDARRD